jgi:hypothetical protein
VKNVTAKLVSVEILAIVQNVIVENLAIAHVVIVKTRF